MKKLKFQRTAGMHDILPFDQRIFEHVCKTAENIARFYSFGKIETPVLEPTDLFVKGTGEGTEVVQKQMFNLKTKGGDFLTLRPEFTPGIVRAYLEHGMASWPQPVKLYSFGPVFRYEHPQAGRYRQFNQFNLEVIGEGGAVIDSQIIQIFYAILKDLKIKNIVLEINSIGDSFCRPYYKKLLTSFFRGKESSLCSDCRRRLKENPLRILDCKEEKCHRIVSQAPQLIDHLCEECHKHFKEVLEFLDELELPYQLNPYLVRGLDYYTKTVFELFTKGSQKPEENQKIALAGGGRYDNLIKLLGGPETKAAGAALGIERVASVLESEGVSLSAVPEPSVFLAQLGDLAKKKGLKLLEEFRKARIPAAESFGKDSLKAQMKSADKAEAKYTLLLGQKEALENKIILRDMQTGKQETLSLDNVVSQIKKRIK